VVKTGLYTRRDKARRSSKFCDVSWLAREGEQNLFSESRDYEPGVDALMARDTHRGTRFFPVLVQVFPLRPSRSRPSAAPGRSPYRQITLENIATFEHDLFVSCFTFADSALHRQRRVFSKMVSTARTLVQETVLISKLISFASRRPKYVYPPSWPSCLHSMAMDVLTEGPLIFITD
jgi:hypothetical protein